MDKEPKEETIKLKREVVKLNLLEGFPSVTTPEEVPTQIEVLVEGSFKGHDFTRETFERIVINHEQGANMTKVPLDYDHPEYNKGDKTIAAGWIESFEVAERIKLDEPRAVLLANISWTNSGREAVFGKEYLYVSPEVQLNFVSLKDDETNLGPVVTAISLTNRPAVFLLSPIIHMSKKNLAKQEKEDTIDKEADKNKTEITEMNEDEKKKMADMESKVAKFEKENGDLKKEMKEYKKKMSLGEREKEVEKLVAENKILPAQKAEAIALSEDAFEGFKLAVKDNEAVKLGASEEKASEKPASKEPTAQLSADEANAELVKLAKKKIEEDKTLDFKTAYLSVLSENKDIAKFAN